MNKIFLAKVASVLIVVMAFIDTNLDVLHGIGFTDLVINWIKFTGLVVAALLPAIPFKIKPKSASVSADDGDIAGGGIKH